MYSAMATSARFLGCYLYYHLVDPDDDAVPPRGPVKTAYLAMLASHVVLAMVNVPLVLRTSSSRGSERLEQHKRWAKVTLPVWLYVSITACSCIFACTSGTDRHGMIQGFLF
jgi:putative membrane protein